MDAVIKPSWDLHRRVTEMWHQHFMMIATLLLLICAALSLLAASIVRTPLFRTLNLAFGSWAESARVGEGELS